MRTAAPVIAALRSPDAAKFVFTPPPAGAQMSRKAQSMRAIYTQIRKNCEQGAQTSCTAGDWPRLHPGQFRRIARTAKVASKRCPPAQAGPEWNRTRSIPRNDRSQGREAHMRKNPLHAPAMSLAMGRLLITGTPASAQTRTTLDMYVAYYLCGNASLLVPPSGESLLIDT